MTYDESKNPTPFLGSWDERREAGNAKAATVPRRGSAQAPPSMISTASRAIIGTAWPILAARAGLEALPSSARL